MSEQTRRDVVRYAGLSVAIGMGVTTVTADGSADDESATTDDSSGWSSIRGDAGNTGFAPNATGPTSPAAVAWEYDHGGSFAVVDGTVYLAADGRVHAIDAIGGSLEWETAITTADGAEQVEVMGPPAVAHDTVYVTTRGRDPDLTALDAATGDRRWQASDLGYETNRAPVVANGRVFVVADKVLYALDARSGERRWQFKPEPMPIGDGRTRGDGFQREPVAVADGTVFAVSNNRLFALDAETGAERWRDRVDDWRSNTFTGYPVAAGGVVAVVKSDAVRIYDAETGSERSTVPSHSLDVLGDDRVYAVIDQEGDRTTVAGYDLETGNRVWQPSDRAGSPVSTAVDDHSVYVGLEASGVAAFGRTDGTREWHVDVDATPRQLAVVGDTVYASGDALFAIRTEDESGGDGGAGGNDEETSAGDGDEASSDVESQSTDGADDTPGFTAGASVAGGTLVLEWLRRRAADE
ncbi:PQQ-binding-like beta-propeller repeat protein [Natribaculum luteum]|uniref:PQQ-binding-like beta-propeller repeat protein n=1 Tax=Natribaculum luteum TaxID=1586232 RepID=A0ABD5NX48_9EURY|nr:PQQ-binding-like beta-propeller repeat protein [Natribaculum luteum]